jgi:hypothetical protein
LHIIKRVEKKECETAEFCKNQLGEFCMGLIELASGNSVWRGMDYYNATLMVASISSIW